MKCLTIDDVIAILKKKQGKKSLRLFAGEIGIHYSQLSAIYNRRLGLKLNAAVLKKIGLKHEDHYLKIP